jgi:two-component system, LytTR family, sensor histidine kinase AlgZ
MRPLLSDRLRLLPYAFIWFGLWALLAAVEGGLQQRPFLATAAFTAPLMLVYAFVCRSARWVCRAHPLDRTPPLRLLGGIGGAAVQASVLWVLLAAAWDVFLTRRLHLAPGHEGLPGDLALVWVAGILLYAQSAAAYYLLLALEGAREVERRLLASQVSAREAELRALRAQLNPHFLFNSLNSISALAGSEPEAARRMCGLLGGFLRTSLALGGRERVSLEEELALADRYLAVEQVRFGPRLAVERAIEPGALRCLVPPLLIQPLIENAVKHGVADRVEGGTIRIAARREGEGLELEVRNPRDPEAPPRRGVGLGLDNVRRRLATLDPQRARLEVIEEPERFRVLLRLPAVDGPPGTGGDHDA